MADEKKIEINTLADFKRFLSTPGALVTLKRHDLLDARKSEKGLTDEQKRMYEPRKVIKVQTKSVQLEGESWMDVDRASEWTFDGSNKVVLSLTDKNTAEYELSYS